MTKTHAHGIGLSTATLLGSLVLSCSGGGPTTDYSGSASYGDLIVFALDKVNSTYTVSNETTGERDTGSYTVLTGDLAGVKEAQVEGVYYYAVELDQKVIAATLPSGNAVNVLAFGVSSAIDNSGKIDQLAGDYVWAEVSNGTINGGTNYKRWGVLSSDSSGNWQKLNYATGGDASSAPVMAPQSVTATLPITSGDESGTYAADGTKQERLTVQAGSDTLSGFAYVAGDTTAFLLDLGTGNGFMLGLKIPATAPTLSDIAGDYKFVDLWSDGSHGAGNYTIGTAGEVSWSHKDDEGLTASGTFANLQAVAPLGNMFYSLDNPWGSSATTDDDIDIHIVVAGPVILHFGFDSLGRFATYGAGAKL